MKKYDIDRESQKLHEIGKWQRKYPNTINRELNRKIHVALIRQMFPDVNKMLCVGARIDHEILTFKKSGFDVLGIDIAYESSLIKRIDAHEMSKYFEKDEFDIVYASHSLEHMHNAEMVLKQTRSIAKNGIFITLPCKGKPYKSHCSVFDIMVEGENDTLPKNINDVGQKKELLKDFKNLEPYELIYCERRLKSKDNYELDLAFKWSR